MLCSPNWWLRWSIFCGPELITACEGAEAHVFGVPSIVVFLFIFSYFPENPPPQISLDNPGLCETNAKQSIDSYKEGEKFGGITEGNCANMWILSIMQCATMMERLSSLSPIFSVWPTAICRTQCVDPIEFKYWMQYWYAQNMIYVM